MITTNSHATTEYNYQPVAATCVGSADDGSGGDAGNGKIDFGEFLLLVHNYERPLPEDVEVREMFNALDKDKNGYIDCDELKMSFAGLGITLTDDDVAEMMSEADVYADRIYFEGFIVIYRNIWLTFWLTLYHTV